MNPCGHLGVGEKVGEVGGNVGTMPRPEDDHQSGRQPEAEKRRAAE